MIKINKHSFSTNKLLSKKGFTLIELLVVIAIIGILATIIVASFTSAQRRGRDAKRKADLDAIKKALTLLRSDSTGGAWYLATSQYPASLGTNYIRVVPTDPSTSTNYTYTGTGACSGTWAVGTAGGCPSYQVSTTLENTADPDDAASAARCGLTGATDTYYVCSE